ncbi:D-2-hydroxyacid dehydrogenase [Cohnella pontilimi]|uniref:D-2-hydroxyacid dehydrogenase n=1 Tax=Cohnella pontilimi TaxID=2564100 RepID=A0A4U0FC17_9BACL|nr:D-2-hydroxyacid dehydrogenase [Cohnella pontilimi]TJY42270.1 D-2-hydroxyacid dehydrogenase [Cohnella pontilimi]
MKITVLDGYALNPGDLSWSGLERLGDVTVYDRTPADLIIERARGSEILLTNKTPLRKETLAELPGLRYIGVLATGYDVVDAKEASERGIVVANVPAYSTDSVAQFVFAMLLELCHHVGRHDESVKRGEWTSSIDFSYWRTPLLELAGKTFGIIGMGRIGARTAEIAAAFGMKVKAYTRRMEGAPPHAFIEWASLDDVLETSDVVSLHCPLTPDTEGLIDRRALSRMKPSAFLINTSRGKLLVEQDVADALNEGRLAGAALDVLSAEPPRNGSPLLTAKNCVITPHIAWATQEARQRLLDAAVKNVEAFLKGKSINVVR